MATASAAAFLDCLRRYHLLDQAQLDAVERKLQGHNPDLQVLIRSLLQRGWLTAYQVDQFSQGRAETLLLDSYVLREPIGEGGMGAVFKACNWKVGQLVALKLIREERLGSPKTIRRFQREIRAGAQLNHPHIVRTLDAGDVGGTCFLAMEFIEGIDLHRVVQQRGPLPVTLACDYVRQAALGLQHAYERGLVHRDIKPSNLLLHEGGPGNAGVVKVLDFGLARLQTGEETSTTLTEPGAVMGTPDYIAPEQAVQSHHVDIRADLYSLGGVLYFLLTGGPPFPGTTVVEKLVRHQLEAPRPVRELRPEVPPGIAAVVHKLLAKKPEDRYQTPAELAEVLTRGGDSSADRAQQPAEKDTAEVWADVADPERTEAAELVARRRRQHEAQKRRLWLQVGAGGGVLLFGLVFLAWFLFRDSRADKAPSVNLDPLAPVVFHVEANRVWQDTGVDFIAGGLIELAPEGTWHKGPRACKATGLEGTLGDQRAVLPEAPLLSLLARIGDEEAPTPVRGTMAFRTKRAGRLFVQANDLDMEANSGSLKLTIRHGEHVSAAAPPTRLLPVQAAYQELKPFLALVEAPGAKPEQVRDRVFEYCMKNAGTPRAFLAGRWLVNKPPLENRFGMKLAPIPPGEFLMGSPDEERPRDTHEGPQHKVILTRPFYVGIHDVTVGQFRAFVKDKPYQTEAENGGGANRQSPDGNWQHDPQANWQNPGFEQPDDHPVVCVSWNDAVWFCQWLSRKEEGKKYELPTEAQWEYACRAGSLTKFYFGNDDQALDQYAWYIKNSGEKTHPVGQKKPNAWGLYDMHGNVWQWTLDFYDAEYYTKSPKKDPQCVSGSDSHVLRGGTWHYHAQDCRAAWRRGGCGPSSSHADGGFRVVLLP
jgi:serine/threonine-protein kinase